MLRSLFILTLIHSGFIFSEVYDFEKWAVGSAMSNVSISTDGNYLSFHQRLSRESDPVLKIFNSDDLSGDPYVLGGETLEIVQSSWIGPEELIVVFRGRARENIEGFNQGVYEYRLALFNMSTKKFTPLNDRGIGSAASYSIGLENTLPYEDNKILISYNEYKRGYSYRATSYYKYTLKTGSKSLVLKGREDYYGINFDEYGNPRYASGFDVGTGVYSRYYRNVGDRSWKEYFSVSEDSLESFRVVSYPTEDSEVYVIANNGEDKEGLWKYNIAQKKFVKKVYSDPEADISGVFGHYNSFKYPEATLGIRTSKAKPEKLYFGGDLSLEQEAVDYQISQAIPNSYYTRISSTSNSGDVLLISNTGPRDPGSYYLYHKGQIKFIGSTRPNFDASKLSDVTFIQYKARDGRVIPAYVTTPNEKKDKYPLIVMPHGGPFVQEMVMWDPWSQLLANNGYMVIQPQYRGSQGWGRDHYESAFNNGGQGGYKMQDDKDDGALYLIEQGKVDPERVAMFGWSYGGYAALIAASREDQIYQCVIAGAPVTDMVQQLNYYKNRLRGTSEIQQVNYRKGSISPINVVDKVNVPVLIIHGEDDQRVPVSHAKKYVDKLEEYNKEYEYLELKDADHFSNTLFYKHKMEFFPKMINYLSNDCGPEGL